MSRIAAVVAFSLVSTFCASFAVAELASDTPPGNTTKPSPSYGEAYAKRLIAAIKPKIVVAEVIPKDAVAEVEIVTEPTGRVASYRLVKSSGVQAWDEAIMRAIDKTKWLPLAVDGTVPPRIIAVFHASAP